MFPDEVAHGVSAVFVLGEEELVLVIAKNMIAKLAAIIIPIKKIYILLVKVSIINFLIYFVLL
jgi:hypothetical protein